MFFLSLDFECIVDDALFLDFHVFKQCLKIRFVVLDGLKRNLWGKSRDIDLFLLLRQIMRSSIRFLHNTNAIVCNVPASRPEVNADFIFSPAPAARLRCRVCQRAYSIMADFLTHLLLEEQVGWVLWVLWVL